ncbi:MAG: hypothetical protein HKL96_13020 [Phycisphaerales bacterium]|nr:hypothetical protein [Phycisphaerales bacterium]
MLEYEKSRQALSVRLPRQNRHETALSSMHLHTLLEQQLEVAFNESQPGDAVVSDPLALVGVGDASVVVGCRHHATEQTMRLLAALAGIEHLLAETHGGHNPFRFVG